MNLTHQLRQLTTLRLPGALLDRLPVEEWRDRLSSCLPAPIRRWLASRGRRLLVVPRGSSADLCIAVGEEREHLGALELSSPAPPPVLVGGPHERRHPTVLMVPAELVVRRTVTFPIQVRENLAQVMRYEIDRLSPFSAEQVCFDYGARPAAGHPERLTVELALCRRDQIKPWIERLRELGRPADQLTWEGGWPRANLLPAEDRPPRELKLVTLTRLLVFTVLVLLGIALISPLWQREQLLERSESELRRVRAEAQQVEDVRQALNRAREGSVAVLRQKLEQPRMTDLLRELTRRLPDDTWIQSLEVRGNEVQLRGESAQATALIELLERERGVNGVTFRSPVTQVARTGTERFNIAFDYSRASPP